LRCRDLEKKPYSFFAALKMSSSEFDNNFVGNSPVKANPGIMYLTNKL
jgi:hypothetical protein